MKNPLFSKPEIEVQSFEDPNTGIELRLIEVSTRKVDADFIMRHSAEIIKEPLLHLDPSHPFFTDPSYNGMDFRFLHKKNCVYCFSETVKFLGIPENLIMTEKFKDFPVHGNVIKYVNGARKKVLKFFPSPNNIDLALPTKPNLTKVEDIKKMRSIGKGKYSVGTNADLLKAINEK